VFTRLSRPLGDFRYIHTNTINYRKEYSKLPLVGTHVMNNYYRIVYMSGTTSTGILNSWNACVNQNMMLIGSRHIICIMYTENELR